MNIISPEIRDRIVFMPVEGALRVRLDDSVTEYNLDGRCLQAPSGITDATRFREWVESGIRYLRGDMVGIYSEIVGRLSKKGYVSLLGSHPFLRELVDIMSEDATAFSRGRIPLHWTKSFQSMFGDGVYRG